MIKSFAIHFAFDVSALLLALLGGWLAYKWRFQTALQNTASRLDTRYFIFLSAGSLAGAYLFGTINLYLSSIPEIGRSILGALFGATLMVEFYKRKRAISGSTGYIYVIPFCIFIIVGRLGCLLSGLDDHTYGIPTNLSWGWDYGDQVLRHPVQLYESLSMFGFLVATSFNLKYFHEIVVRYGYYLCVGFYSSQRFFWEFLKPYSDVTGPLNTFQILCIALFTYSAVMILKTRNEHRTT